MVRDTLPPTDRRRFLVGLAASPLLTGFASPVVGRVLAMSDLHSAYERTGQLLAALEAEVAAHPAPHVIAVNGDAFEHGNVVAVRSGGAIDWAFLSELPKIAPTVFNLGNHDNDIVPDLADVVARLRALGLTVVSTIINARTGAPYAPATAVVPMGARSLQVVGMATNSLPTYPAASRPALAIPAPGEWARANLAKSLAGADLSMVMSHAGVAADREILPLLPDGALMIGGHNHLSFQHRQGRSLYVHTGSWSNAFTAVPLRIEGPADGVSRQIAVEAPSSPRLASLISTTLSQAVTEQERTVLGVSARALSLGETGRAVARAMAQAAGADAGFVGHTTLGAGLPFGPVTRFAFDAVVRFEGKLMVAEASRTQLAWFVERANQDRPMSVDQRRGDFLYAETLAPAQDQAARIVTTDWCASNQAEYFGVTDLAFSEVPGLRLKTVAAGALLAGS